MIDSDASQLSQGKIRYAFLRDRKGFPRVCIARFRKDNCVTFGYAVCNPKDRFSKKLGREIASGRALVSPMVLPLDGDKPLTTVMKWFLSRKVDEIPCRNTLVKLAGKWLATHEEK